MKKEVAVVCSRVVFSTYFFTDLLSVLTFTYIAYLFAYLINFLTLLTYFLTYLLTLYLVTYVLTSPTYFTYLINFLILLTYLLTYLLHAWRTWLGDVRQRGVGRRSGQFHADVGRGVRRRRQNTKVYKQNTLIIISKQQKWWVAGALSCQRMLTSLFQLPYVALHTLRLIARQPWRHCVTSLRSKHWMASSRRAVLSADAGLLVPIGICYVSCQRFELFRGAVGVDTSSLFWCMRQLISWTHTSKSARQTAHLAVSINLNASSYFEAFSRQVRYASSYFEVWASPVW